MPTKSSTLPPVEEATQVIESTIEPEEEEASTQQGDGHPLEPAIAQLAERVVTLEARLATAESYISHLASIAHSEHHMELGAAEIAAIASALTPVLAPSFQQTIFGVLKEHYGFAPPLIRGDR